MFGTVLWPTSEIASRKHNNRIFKPISSKVVHTRNFFLLFKYIVNVQKYIKYPLLNTAMRFIHSEDFEIEKLISLSFVNLTSQSRISKRQVGCWGF